MRIWEKLKRWNKSARERELYYPNFRVRALVVRSLLTGDTWVAGDRSVLFLLPGREGPPRHRPLTEQEANSLTRSQELIRAICDRVGISPLTVKSDTSQLVLIMKEACGWPAWIEIEEPITGSLSWEPVEFVPYDWRTLSGMGVFAEAGRQLLTWLGQVALAALGFCGLVAAYLFFLGFLGLMPWCLVALPRYFRSGGRGDPAVLFDKYSLGALIIPAVLLGAYAPFYFYRKWPYFKVGAWVNVLNRNRESEKGAKSGGAGGGEHGQ